MLLFVFVTSIDFRATANDLLFDPRNCGVENFYRPCTDKERWFRLMTNGIVCTTALLVSTLFAFLCVSLVWYILCYFEFGMHKVSDKVHDVALATLHWWDKVISSWTFIGLDVQNASVCLNKVATLTTTPSGLIARVFKQDSKSRKIQIEDIAVYKHHRQALSTALLAAVQDYQTPDVIDLPQERATAEAPAIPVVEIPANPQPPVIVVQPPVQQAQPPVQQPNPPVRRQGAGRFRQLAANIRNRRNESAVVATTKLGTTNKVSSYPVTTKGEMIGRFCVVQLTHENQVKYVIQTAYHVITDAKAAYNADITLHGENGRSLTFCSLKPLMTSITSDFMFISIPQKVVSKMGWKTTKPFLADLVNVSVFVGSPDNGCSTLKRKPVAINPLMVNYHINTIPGDSGTPIARVGHNEVLGLHTTGNNNMVDNSGTELTSVYKTLIKLLFPAVTLPESAVGKRRNREMAEDDYESFYDYLIVNGEIDPYEPEEYDDIIERVYEQFDRDNDPRRENAEGQSPYQPREWNRSNIRYNAEAEDAYANDGDYIENVTTTNLQNGTITTSMSLGDKFEKFIVTNFKDFYSITNINQFKSFLDKVCNQDFPDALDMVQLALNRAEQFRDYEDNRLNNVQDEVLEIDPELNAEEMRFVVGNASKNVTDKPNLERKESKVPESFFRVFSKTSDSQKELNERMTELTTLVTSLLKKQDEDKEKIEKLTSLVSAKKKDFQEKPAATAPASLQVKKKEEVSKTKSSKKEVSSSVKKNTRESESTSHQKRKTLVKKNLKSGHTHPEAQKQRESASSDKPVDVCDPELLKALVNQLSLFSKNMKPSQNPAGSSSVPEHLMTTQTKE